MYQYDPSDPGPQFAYEDSYCDSTLHIDIVFPPVPLANVTLTVSGTGTGQVTASPSTVCVGCGSIYVTKGMNVNIAAIPDASSVFDGWVGTIPAGNCATSGEDCINGANATIFADGSRTVTAIFDLLPPPPPGGFGCWVWDATLGNQGGYKWTCTSPSPPAGGGVQPQVGCWHWDPNSGPFGAWLRDICGGGCGLNLTTGLPMVYCPPGGIFGGKIIEPGDPNDKGGTQGTGSQQYVAASTPLLYAISYGNEATASANAQTVVITDPLNTSVDDLTTFSFGPISVAGQTLFPPPGTTYSTTIDMRPGTNLLVGVNARLDSNAGIATWRFTSIDPATGLPTTNPTAGFLPPGANGSVFFTVMPKQNVTSGTQIQNQATIVFDANPSMNTPTWLNTFDVTAPASQVQALPSTEMSSSFVVQWQGTDIGSGVQDYTVYASVDGAAFAVWLTNTAATSGTWTGLAGHAYSFYSLARDLVGNVEAAKTSAEATTIVSTLSNVTSSVKVTSTGFLYSRATRTYNGTITVTNVSGSAISGPLQIGFGGLPGGVTLTNATTANDGIPFVTLPAGLAPGQSTAFTVQFGDPSNLSITYSPIVYSGAF
ncbi:hypothetical protein [Edaphobacter aggregans]|nr:hypothetical protein [Edaphobacter aggregans]